MKRFIYPALLTGAICLTAVYQVMSQAPVPLVPPVVKAERVEKAEQKEIVIRQKGDKDTKLTLEIKNGDLFINGKPVDKFDDKNIVVEQRDVEENILEVPEIAVGPSPFRMHRGDEERMEWEKNKMEWEKNSRDMQNMQRDVQRNIRKSLQIRMNEAFLGISSRRAEKGGATVLEVTEGSPAQKAGIKKGDIITKVNDAKIESPETLFETIHSFKPGEKVKIVFTRDGKEQAVTATLDKSDKGMAKAYNYNFKMPPMPDMEGMQMGPWGPSAPKLGIKAQETEDGKGVQILEVEDSSAASKAGLKKGDIIVEFNGSDVNSTNKLIEQLQDARQKPAAKVKILRNGVSQEIEVKMPRKLKTAEL